MLLPYHIFWGCCLWVSNDGVRLANRLSTQNCLFRALWDRLVPHSRSTQKQHLRDSQPTLPNNHDFQLPPFPDHVNAQSISLAVSSANLPRIFGLFQYATDRQDDAKRAGIDGDGGNVGDYSHIGY